MNIKSTQHTRQDVLAATPNVREIFTKLENFSHGYQVTTGDFLPNFVPPELALSPMLIVCSKRISDAWCQRPLRGHPIPTMNWVTGIGRRTNWTWLGDDLCIAFDGVIALELLCDAYEAERPLLIAWVTTNLVTIDEVWADQDYLDSMSRALTDAWLPISAQQNLSFGVPSDQLPPLLSAEEERYVSEDGRLVYVAHQC